MGTITWICMFINAAAALFLLVMLFNPGQDAAGKGMLFLPIIVLFGTAAASWWLKSRGYSIAALLVSGIPAVIALYLLWLELEKQQQ